MKKKIGLLANNNIAQNFFLSLSLCCGRCLVGFFFVLVMPMLRNSEEHPAKMLDTVRYDLHAIATKIIKYGSDLSYPVQLDDVGHAGTLAAEQDDGKWLADIVNSTKSNVVEVEDEKTPLSTKTTTTTPLPLREISPESALLMLMIGCLRDVILFRHWTGD